MSADYIDFVLLANSRKHGGVCVAGKKHSDKTWVRPVYDTADGAVPSNRTKSCTLLQHVSIPMLSKDFSRSRHQRENVLVDKSGQWYEQKKFQDFSKIKDLLDAPKSIWVFPDETDLNRVSQQTINRGLVTNSLYFLKIENVRFRIAWTYDHAKRRPRRHLMASFHYQGMNYEFPVTDPYVEKAFEDKKQGVYACSSPEIFACVSLGEPYAGYCYKLVASILCKERCLNDISCDRCQYFNIKDSNIADKLSADPEFSARLDCLESRMDQLLNHFSEADVSFNVNQIEPMIVELLKCKNEPKLLTKIDQLESLLDELWKSSVMARLKALIESESIDESESNIKKLKVLKVECIDKRSPRGGNLWIVDNNDPELEAIIKEIRSQGAKIKPDIGRSCSHSTGGCPGWYHPQ